MWEPNNIIRHSVFLKPQIISYLIGHHSFSNKRVALMNENRYGLVHLHALNIRKWYGTSYIVVFKRGVSNMKGFTYTKKDVKNKIK